MAQSNGSLSSAFPPLDTDVRMEGNAGLYDLNALFSGFNGGIRLSYHIDVSIPEIVPSKLPPGYVAALEFFNKSYNISYDLTVRLITGIFKISGYISISSKIEQTKIYVELYYRIANREFLFSLANKVKSNKPTEPSLIIGEPTTVTKNDNVAIDVNINKNIWTTLNYVFTISDDSNYELRLDVFISQSVELRNLSGSIVQSPGLNIIFSNTDTDKHKCKYSNNLFSVDNGKIRILIRSNFDHFGGANLSQCIFAIQDIIPYNKIFCTDNSVKISDTLWQISYSRTPDLTPLVIGDECNLMYKLLAIFNIEDNIKEDIFEMISGFLIYSLTRYFIGFLLYGRFDVNILLRKYTCIFFDDLSRSRYHEFIKIFQHETIKGFEKFYKLSRYQCEC